MISIILQPNRRHGVFGGLKRTLKKDDKPLKSIDDDRNDSQHHGIILSKIDQLSRGQKKFVRRIFLDILTKSPQNANNICDFIIAERNEINIKESADA